MNLFYEKERLYEIDFSNNGEQIKIEVCGNIGRFGCYEPLFDWKGSVVEFVELLSKEVEDSE